MTAMPELYHELRALGYLVYPVHGQRRWVAILAHDGQRPLIYETAPLTRTRLEQFLVDARRGAEGPWLRSRPVPIDAMPELRERAVLLREIAESEEA
jgi:hypothetical protein